MKDFFCEKKKKKKKSYHTLNGTTSLSCKQALERGSLCFLILISIKDTNLTSTIACSSGRDPLVVSVHQCDDVMELGSFALPS